MNCKKCGKEIDYEAEVCNECATAEVNVEEVATEEAVAAVTINDGVAAKNPKMIGFGKALTSLILPIVGAILIGIVSGLLAVAAQDAYAALEKFIEDPELIVNGQTQELSVAFKNFLENDIADLGIFLVLLVGAGIVAFVLGVVGIIFGAQSISCFKKESRNSNKPLPTLIVGILGLVESAGMVLGILSAVASVAVAVFYIISSVL